MIPKLSSFIEFEIAQKDPKRAETAVLLMGMCMDGPSDQCLAPMVAKGVPHLIELLAHPELLIRQTTA